LTNRFHLRYPEIETHELRPGGKLRRAFLLAGVAMQQSAMQQSHITQAVARLILAFQAILRWFPALYLKWSSGARPVKAMHSGHGHSNAPSKEFLPGTTKMPAPTPATPSYAHSGAPGVASALFFTMK